MIRVLVVDDHEFVREELVATLRGAGDFEVVGTCDNGKQAIDQAASPDPTSS